MRERNEFQRGSEQMGLKIITTFESGIQVVTEDLRIAMIPPLYKCERERRTVRSKYTKVN